MEKILKGKKFFAFTKGLACFTGILLIMLAVFSCTNMLIRDGGSLIIALPGARAATASRFTIELTGTNGTPKSQTLDGGTTAQFDDLAPDTYSIVVKGMDASDSVVFYGTSSATVKAGERKSADVELKKGASDFASLEAAVAAGGKVYIFENIDVKSGLTVGTTVEILPAYQNVTLTNNSSENLFTVDTNGNLTIGGGEHTITLDGNTLSHHAIYMKNTGKATLSRNAIITNCGTASVKFYDYNTTAYFYLEGGSITGNNGSGVEISSNSEFYMNSGIIEKNKASNGGGVSLDGGKFYLNGGSITGNNASQRGGGVNAGRGHLEMNGGYITENEATTDGGGVYFEKSIVMTGGYIGGNKSLSNSGNGVFHNGDNNGFEMSGSAVVAPDNDVYLNRYKTITITGELTGGDTAATITPNKTDGYTAGTQVLSAGDGVTLTEDIISKFAVTPNGNTPWTIDTSGNLKEQ